MRFAECHECRAIIGDYIDAWREVAAEMASSRLFADKEFAQAWHQARRLRTEEDVILAEGLFPKVQIKSSERLSLALGRKFVHQARTGHKVDLGRR